jgi:Fe-S-cluster containining protein
VRLLLSSEQRFTCAQCGRCCHRTTVPISSEEADALRKAGAANWFDDVGAKADPFEAIPRHPGLLRIRKRLDGACGFLTAEGRCRIHEVLGADRKPLACRMFPFSFHTIRGAGAPGRENDETIVSTSFACPTVIANEGAPMTAQRGQLRTLHTAWDRVSPETKSEVEIVRGQVLSRAALARLRTFLTLMLDRPRAGNPNALPDVRANLRRIAALLEDWTRPRVMRLDPDALVEYMDLTGNYALSADHPPPQRDPSRVARLLFRGFLFAVVSLQVRLDRDAATSKPALVLTLTRLLAHVHGAGPAVAGFNLRRAMRLPLRLDDPGVHAIVHRHLQTGFEALGATRRPLLDEIALRVASLNAGIVVGAMHAVRAGKPSVDADSLAQGLLASGDLSHADAGGRLSALLTTLAAGIEALYLFPPLAPPPIAERAGRT